MRLEDLCGRSAFVCLTRPMWLFISLGRLGATLGVSVVLQLRDRVVLVYLPVTVEGGPVGSILSGCTDAMGAGKGGVVLCKSPFVS